MSVKEVLQTLVDDNLVDTDKIGTSIYFWAYPSKAMHTVSTLQSTLTIQRTLIAIELAKHVACECRHISSQWCETPAGNPSALAS